MTERGPSETRRSRRTGCFGLLSLAMLCGLGCAGLLFKCGPAEPAITNLDDRAAFAYGSAQQSNRPFRKLPKMSSYNEPSFQQRQANAAAAKEKALNQLRARPKIDEAALAERKAASEQREAAKAEKIAAKKAAEQAAIEAKAAEAAALAAELLAKNPPPVLPTAAELKAARDARYANRKKRK